jgi:hypothetical protein
MILAKVRTARPSITLNGVDYYNQLAPYLLRFMYTDSCDGAKTDDCQFDLADRDRKFINEWMPIAGATFDASIICERWFALNAAALSLPCGTFYIDSVEFDLPAHTVSIKSNAIPNNTHGKVSNETRPWGDGAQGGPGITLKDIAQKICDENPPLQLNYIATRNPQYDRVEQVEESAFQFLKRHAEDAKLEIKVAKGFLIVYDPLTMDQQPPSFTLVYGNVPAPQGTNTRVFRMSGGQFRLQVTDLTASVVINNSDLNDGTTTSRQFDANSLLPPEVGGTGPSVNPNPAPNESQIPTAVLPEQWKDILNWNTDAKKSGDGGSGSGPPSRDVGVGTGEGLQSYWSNDASAGDAALTKAQARAREKNRRHYESDIEMSIGNPLIAAGATFMLVGCGQFDGLWFIETARHVVNPPLYDTFLHVRRTLEGY